MSYVGMGRFPRLSGGIIPKASFPDKVKGQYFPRNDMGVVPVRERTAREFIRILADSQE